jgi:outer membrane protein assembly factor BamB
MIRRVALPLCSVLACTVFTAAQNRDVNWPTYSGDAQRSGWQKTETRITKDTVKDLQLLWKLKLEAQPKGPRPLLPPVILGRLISYRGFKELAFVATNSDMVYAVDADLGKMFWQKHLEFVSNEAQAAGSSATCPGGLTATPVMPVPAPPAAPAAPAPPATPAAAGRGARGNALPVNAGPSPLYVLSSDGRIHRLNTSTGDDRAQPVSVLPANARVASLNLVDNVIYTATSPNCNDAPDAVWAIDLNGDELKAASFPLTGSSAGSGGVAIGTDGTVYAAGSDTLYALSPRDLKLRESFPAGGKITAGPIVLKYKTRDIVVIGQAGAICLLDSSSLYCKRPGTEHLSTISGISTFEEAGGTQSVLVAGSDGIASYKLDEEGGHPALTLGWTSREINSPLTPVIANGVVFGLSSSGRATLYGLDAATGKELYSSRNSVTGPVSPTGLTVANGRVYFGGADGTFYAFGIYMEH